MINIVRQRVLPTFPYHSELKSVYYPLNNGKNPNNFVFSNFILTIRITIAILINYISKIFVNCPAVSSLIVCFFSTKTIFSKIVFVMMLITVTTKAVPTTILF